MPSDPTLAVLPSRTEAMVREMLTLDELALNRLLLGLTGQTPETILDILLAQDQNQRCLLTQSATLNRSLYEKIWTLFFTGIAEAPGYVALRSFRQFMLLFHSKRDGILHPFVGVADMDARFHPVLARAFVNLPEASRVQFLTIMDASGHTPLRWMVRPHPEVMQPGDYAFTHRDDINALLLHLVSLGELCERYRGTEAIAPDIYTTAHQLFDTLAGGLVYFMLGDIDLTELKTRWSHAMGKAYAHMAIHESGCQSQLLTTLPGSMSGFFAIRPNSEACTVLRALQDGVNNISSEWVSGVQPPSR